MNELAANPDAVPGSVSTRRLSFTPAFDGVRGVAILLVMSYHVRMLDPWLDGHVLPKGGSLGVDIFFVLSGFLITALLLREQASSGHVRFRSFYRRRALRLLPALLLFVVVYLIDARVEHFTPAAVHRAVLAVTFYYWNWSIVTAHPLTLIPPGIAHLWSLSVEEQFYIVWPLLFVLFVSLRRRLTTAVAVVGAGIIAVVVARALLLQHTAPGILYFRTDMRADSLLVGALAARIWVSVRIPARALQAMAWVSFGFVAYCVARLEYQSHFLFNGGYTLLAIAVAIMLIAIVDTAWVVTRVLTWRGLRAVGRVSYGLYIWHYFAFNLVSRHTETWNSAGRVVLGLALAIVATVLSWYLVEKPFLRLKSRPRAALASQTALAIRRSRRAGGREARWRRSRPRFPRAPTRENADPPG